MEKLKKVLLVTNGTTDTEILDVQKAFGSTDQQAFNIKLSLVHVIPTLPSCYFNIPSMVLLAERYYEEAKKTLTYIGGLLQIPQQDQWLMTGRMRNEVLRLAAKLKSQYILASSSSLQDLHKTFLFSRHQDSTLIKNINQFNFVIPA